MSHDKIFVGDASETPKRGIAVAMCTYNGQSFLQEQLQSIAAQKCLPVEMIVCDDGSTDETLEILERFARTSSFPIRIYRNETRLGSTKNFEKAIALCNAEIIALSDQDDVWYPQKLQRLSEAFTEDIDLVFSDGDVVASDLTPMGFNLWKSVLFNRKQQKCVKKNLGFSVLLRHNVVTGATMAFRSRVREVIFPIPSTWIHDGWIAFHVAALGRITMVEDRLIAYRQHAHNQIGAVRYSYLSALMNIFNARSAPRGNVLTQYGKALEHLQRHVQRQNCDYVPRLEQKLSHERIRLAACKDGGVMNLFKLHGELICGNYHRYGSGLLSYGKDMVLVTHKFITLGRSITRD